MSGCWRRRGASHSPGSSVSDSDFRHKYEILDFVDMDRESAGRALYEERSKTLRGLMMPEAPAWDELTEDIKERWRGYTDQRPVA